MTIYLFIYTFYLNFTHTNNVTGKMHEEAVEHSHFCLLKFDQKLRSHKDDELRFQFKAPNSIFLFDVSS